jgi:amino acid transporter
MSNEEVKHRRVNPGRAAMLAVVILTLLYVLVITGLQGVVSPARLQAHSADALVYAAQAIGGTGWARVMALALALSVIAATGTSIVLTARIVYGMASWRALPGRLANISRRFATPVSASILTGVLVIALTWVYLLATSIQGAFTAVVNVSGLLFGVFYILTALATIFLVHYRACWGHGEHSAAAGRRADPDRPGPWPALVDLAGAGVHGPGRAGRESAYGLAG